MLYTRVIRGMEYDTPVIIIAVFVGLRRKIYTTSVYKRLNSCALSIEIHNVRTDVMIMVAADPKNCTKPNGFLFL